MTGAGVTSLKLELTWVPRLDCPGVEGAGEDVVAKQPPWTCSDGSSLHGPQSPDPGGPSTPQPSLVHPKNGGPSGLEELRNVTWSARVPVVGFPRAASFLRVVLHLRMTAPSTRRLDRGWELSEVGGRARGNKEWNTSPWVILLAPSTLIHDPGTGLVLRLL